MATAITFCTRSTGRQYAEIDRSLLTTCKRLMYRCPDGPGDGMEVDYRSSDLDIAECLSAIRRENQIFDVALIIPSTNMAPRGAISMRASC